MADRPPRRTPESATPQLTAEVPFEWRVAFATELFSRPDVDSPIRAHLPAGAPLALLEEHGAFRRVRTVDGHVGYVGKLAVVRQRTPSRRTQSYPGPPDEPPPLPWELERAGESRRPPTDAPERVAAQDAHGPERSRDEEATQRAATTPSAAGDTTGVRPESATEDHPLVTPVTTAGHIVQRADDAAPPAAETSETPLMAEEPSDRSLAEPPADESPRRRGPLGWLRGRRVRRRGTGPQEASVADRHGQARRLGRRALRLVGLLLMLIGLFEVLGWMLGLVQPPRPPAAEPPGSPIVAAVRGPEGSIDVSLDAPALAAAAGVGVVWIVLTTAAFGSGAALPAALVVPALGLTTALNAATGLTPLDRVIVIDLDAAVQQTGNAGPALAVRQVSGQRVTLTLRSDVAARLPGVPSPARPRVAAGSAAGGAAAGAGTPARGSAMVPRPPGALDLGFILDASGSMLERIDGRPKSTIAKEVLNEFLASVDSSVHVGLWVYGHRRGDRTSQCQQIELLQPIGPVDPEALRARIEEVTPFGWTPLAAALQVAARDFRRLPGVAEVLVLISDGEETCGGDPAKVAEEVKRANPNLTIHTVGLAVTEETRRQLERIASVGGGSYYDARDARALAAALAAIRGVRE